MSRTETSSLEELLAEEAEAVDLDRDAPITPATEVSQPNRGKAKVLSVRLSDDEMAALQSAADAVGLPPSTMVRSLIAQHIVHRPQRVDEVRAEALEMAIDVLNRAKAQAVSGGARL